MDADSRRKLIETYERSLEQHGPTVRALKWADEKGQRERFRLLGEVGPWTGASVADVGCGLGDLFGFLRDGRYGLRRYVGYDLSARMVEAARRKYPQRWARFEVRDILEDGLDGRFDYVVASGTFNLKVRDHDAFVQRMLAVMFASCRLAVAFNLFRPDPDPHWTQLCEWAGYYCAPLDKILGYCRSLSPRVQVRAGADQLESTFLVYRT